MRLLVWGSSSVETVSARSALLCFEFHGLPLTFISDICVRGHKLNLKFILPLNVFVRRRFPRIQRTLSGPAHCQNYRRTHPPAHAVSYYSVPAVHARVSYYPMHRAGSVPPEGDPSNFCFLLHAVPPWNREWKKDWRCLPPLPVACHGRTVRCLVC